MSFFRKLFSNPSDDDNSSPENLPEDSTIEITKPVSAQEQPTMNKDENQPVKDTDELPSSTEPEEDDKDTLPQRPDELGSVIAQKQLEITTDMLAPSVPPGITRPLPIEPILPTQRGHIIFGQASDQGMVRSNNQDSAMSVFFSGNSIYDQPDFGIFIVADGMGGHQEGEKASAITARAVANEVMSTLFVPMLRGDDMNGSDQPTIVETLVSAVQKANERVRAEVADGGTTLTAVAIRGDAAHVAHVGDSRAYWIRKSEIEKITRDHSVVERLIELGQLTADEAEQHDQRNVLYRAIGQNEDVEVEIHRKRLTPNSYLLICSDGLWNMVKPAEIIEIISNTPDPQEACEKLVARANAHGGTDNITVILIKTPNS